MSRASSDSTTKIAPRVLNKLHTILRLPNFILSIFLPGNGDFLCSFLIFSRNDPIWILSFDDMQVSNLFLLTHLWPLHKWLGFRCVSPRLKAKDRNQQKGHCEGKSKVPFKSHFSIRFRPLLEVRREQTKHSNAKWKDQENCQFSNTCQVFRPVGQGPFGWRWKRTRGVTLP
jgi:hypothetical protein